MCGRFALSLDAEEIDRQLEGLQLHVDSWLNQDDYHPYFNLAPQNKAAVVRRAEHTETRLVIDCMKWGLVPHWTESPPTYGTLLNTINARDDRVLETQGLWNSIKRRKRCIVLCEGFFEWLTKGKDKIPHFTKRTDGKLMCLAGLWDSVTYKEATEELHTFTIITTSSNKYLSFLHDRMPVILPDRCSMETWLDTSSLEWSTNLSNILKPFDDPVGLVCYPVPKEVGKVGNQSPDFLKPISERKGNIMSFFKVVQPIEKKPKPTFSLGEQRGIKDVIEEDCKCKSGTEKKETKSWTSTSGSSSKLKQSESGHMAPPVIIDIDSFPDKKPVAQKNSLKRSFDSAPGQVSSTSPKKKTN